VAWTEAHLHAKCHLDPFNRLATVHQRHRQDRQDRQRSDSLGRTVLQTVAQERLFTLLVDVGRHVNGTLIDVDADVVEMLVFVEQEFARVESFRHRITDL